MVYGSQRGRPVASGGGRALNPISNRGADYNHHSTRSPLGFSDLATALRGIVDINSLAITPRTHMDINHRPLNRPIKWPNANLLNTLISVSMLIRKTGIGHCGNDVAQKTVAKVFVLSATKFLAKSDLHWIGDCHI